MFVFIKPKYFALQIGMLITIQIQSYNNTVLLQIYKCEANLRLRANKWMKFKEGEIQQHLANNENSLKCSEWISGWESFHLILLKFLN